MKPKSKYINFSVNNFFIWADEVCPLQYRSQVALIIFSALFPFFFYFFLCANWYYHQDPRFNAKDFLSNYQVFFLN